MPNKNRERMSSVDTAWLRMDRPSNLMMICGVLIFRERLSLVQLKRTLADRFLSYPRFRQRAVQTAAGVYWATDAGFNLKAHAKAVALPNPGGKTELQALASALMATPLDPARPLWHFDLVDRYGSGSAVVVRIHHCYADGIALIRVMLSMTDTAAGAAPRSASPSPTQDEDSEHRPPGDSTDAIADAVRFAKNLGSKVLEKGAALWHEPAKAVALAEQGSALTMEIAKLAAMGEDARTLFKGTPGAVKRVAWAEPLPLDEIKAIGRALACSINDVLLSSVAGALRAYLAARGERVDGVVIRAIVPVNLRGAEHATALGNRFGLVFLDLPIGIENPVERLYAIRANMGALKGSYQPMLAMGVLAAMGAGPRMLQEQLLAMLSKNATAVMTNVPGPQQPLFLGHARIDSMMFWVPQSGDIGMGVSILSYDGAVQFGLVTDEGLCPDPDNIIDRIAAEFEKLLLATLMSPWPWDAPPSADAIAAAVQIQGHAG